MVDILKTLKTVMLHNTKNYQTDFQYDRQMVLDAVKHFKSERWNFLWMSRPCGTECFYERDVYIRETYAHHAWLYHAENNEYCIAYAVEILASPNGVPLGNLYPLDLRQSAAGIRREALHAHTVRLAFADGYETCVSYPDYRQSIQLLIAGHGAVTDQVMEPEDGHALDAVLSRVRTERYKN